MQQVGPKMQQQMLGAHALNAGLACLSPFLSYLARGQVRKDWCRVAGPGLALELRVAGAPTTA